MSEELKHKIYSATDCISEQTMFDYIDNKLNAKEQHIVEKHLLDCDLCSDALEGIELLKDRNRITTINLKINERIISIPKKENKIIFFNFKTITSIAAAVALLIGGVFLFNQFASKEMKESDVAELKKESPPPPPPVTINDAVSGTVSDSKSLKQPESITTKNTAIQFETTSKTQQQIALAEEQKPDSYYKNSISSSEGVPVNTAKTGNAITQTDENMEINIPAESSNSKVDLLEREKDLTIDETKKAEEKNENTNVTSFAQAPTPAQKNADDYSVADKKTEKVSKNNRYQSDTKGKDKAAKEPAYGVVAGNAGYATQDVIADQENSKAVQTRAESNQNLIADSTIVFRNGEPQFPGGSDSLTAFIKKNFVYPTNNFKWNSSMGTKIVVEFTIDTKGNILDPKIKQGINTELNEKAIEMVKKMPKWIPVSKPVKYVLPIRLDLK